MPSYIVDPTRFYAEGAIVDWRSLARRLGLEGIDANKLEPTVELRWMLSAELGMPTEPFQVWTRAHVVQGIEKPLAITQTQMIFLNLLTAVTWPDDSMSN